jgi:hypothetical protein
MHVSRYAEEENDETRHDIKDPKQETPLSALIRKEH